ncbi:hypothetical protein [Providencia huaxiensis]|uniref:hypothetical protein n=1 Tax=Providencia huaxiensis TaxID=2027290 RepID=UPI0034E4F763
MGQNPARALSSLFRDNMKARLGSVSLFGIGKFFLNDRREKRRDKREKKREKIRGGGFGKFSDKVGKEGLH